MDSLLESYAFSRSATCACSGIKPEYDGLAAIVTEFYFTACVVFDQKIRRNIANIEHYDLLKKIEVLTDGGNIGKQDMQIQWEKWQGVGG